MFVCQGYERKKQLPSQFVCDNIGLSVTAIECREKHNSRISNDVPMRLMLMFSCVSMSFLMEKVVFAIPFEWFFPLTLPHYPRRAIISFFYVICGLFSAKFLHIYYVLYSFCARMLYYNLEKKSWKIFNFQEYTNQSPMKWIIYSWKAIMTDNSWKK